MSRLVWLSRVFAKPGENDTCTKNGPQSSNISHLKIYYTDENLINSIYL